MIASSEHTTTTIHPLRHNPQLRVLEWTEIGVADHVVADSVIVREKTRPITEEPHLVETVDIEPVLRKPKPVIPLHDHNLEPHPPCEPLVTQRLQHIPQTKLRWI